VADVRTRHPAVDLFRSRDDRRRSRLRRRAAYGHQPPGASHVAVAAGYEALTTSDTERLRRVLRREPTTFTRGPSRRASRVARRIRRPRSRHGRR
jgi:hypothetical protein